MDREKSIFTNKVLRPISSSINKNVFETEKEYKSALAMAQISQLIPYYTTPIEFNELHWCIILNEFKEIIIQCYTHKNDPNILRFKFIEEAQRFIIYNKQLIKDYFML